MFERGKGCGLGDLMPAVLHVRGGLEEVGRPGVAMLMIRQHGMGLRGMGSGRGGMVPGHRVMSNLFRMNNMHGSKRRGAEG